MTDSKSTPTSTKSTPSEEKLATILIVEDEVHLATGMRYSLERENYSVVAVHDGPSALALITEDPERFNLIILDIMLPGMSGYTICEKIREMNILTPVMFLSVRTLPEDRARGFAVGANQYMSKPFELEEFLARIRNMLELHRRQTQLLAGKSASGGDSASELPAKLKIGSAIVDFQTLEVESNGKTLRLTALEMALLQYFVENPNRLISKEELLENVWKMSASVNTRAPDQFMLRLRKIFEPDPTSPVHFLTYRNAGYRFVQEPEEHS